jgi:hypothetical protein
LIRTYSQYRLARQIVLGTVGGAITLLGVVLLILPGPAIILLPLGLAILGAEFAWARRMLRRVRDSVSR